MRCIILLSLVVVLGDGQYLPMGTASTFTNTLLQTLSEYLKSNGPLTKALSGAMKQTCYLHNVHHFFLNTNPTCYNTDKPNIVKIVFQLRFPDLKLQCVQFPKNGLGMQSGVVPDDVTIFTQNAVVQVTTLEKYYAADKSETFVELVRHGVSRYQIDPKYQGSEVEKNIPQVYYPMIGTDLVSMLPAHFTQAYQLLGQRENPERVLVKSCF